MADRSSYIGRFAPSPTGDLHFGSLVAALGSFLQARSRGGLWLLRIEDIDPPREVPGSAARICADLERLGLHWDGEVLYQSSRLETYRSCWQGLLEAGHAFRCDCSRKHLPGSGVYPGTCRDRTDLPASLHRVRIRVPQHSIGINDLVQGRFTQHLGHDVGDFVICRADGFPAYQLAVVLDDASQGVTEVVRGADLLDSTPRQVALQRILGLPTPDYCHLPAAVLEDGRKLSKRYAADPVRDRRPEMALAMALEFLGHRPPRSLDRDHLLEWAIEHWNPAHVPRCRRAPAPGVVWPG